MYVLDKYRGFIQEASKQLFNSNSLEFFEGLNVPRQIPDQHLVLMDPE